MHQYFFNNYLLRGGEVIAEDPVTATFPLLFFIDYFSLYINMLFPQAWIIPAQKSLGIELIYYTLILGIKVWQLSMKTSRIVICV